MTSPVGARRGALMSRQPSIHAYLLLALAMLPLAAMVRLRIGDEPNRLKS